MISSFNSYLSKQTAYWTKAVLTLGMVILLAGCITTASKPLDYDATKGSAYYLSLAQNSSGKEQVNWNLLAARSLISENKLSQAKNILSQLPDNLSGEQKKEQLLNLGELAVKQRTSFDIAQLNVDDLSEAQKIRYYHIRIGVSGQKGDTGAQLRDYITLEQLGTEQQRHQTINETWDFLTSLSDAQVNKVIVYVNEVTLQGWIDLLYTYRNSGGAYTGEFNTPEEQEHFLNLKNAIHGWQIQYSSNPAAIYLPRNIYGEARRLPETDNHLTVALFLPLSGSSKVFGETIRLGYMDASKFYPSEQNQNINVYDTTAAPIADLAVQAQQQGANLIVGPLLKNNVSAMEALAINVPVLALNRTDAAETGSVTAANVCYFALSPEDEARDAARHIFSQRKQMPLVIAPQGDLGRRVANAFAQQWLELKGEANAYVQYFASADQLSRTMNKGVGLEVNGELIIDRSQLPHDPMEQDPLAGLILQAQPDTSTVVDSTEPAEDIVPEIDSIYVFATADELTLIKPMLDMKSEREKEREKAQAERAAQLAQAIAEGNTEGIEEEPEAEMKEKPTPPIYSSSRSHSVNSGGDFSNEMDRVQFSEIPLIVNQADMLETLPSYIKNDYSLVRLYAMGIDAWRLANRYDELKPYKADFLEGMTGKLSVVERCDVTRELIWQQYRRGTVVPVR
ncbi:penicillin-binding protein activator [Zophobihabitans entericus]|uniref:Uncharacterized protein n=1 Tax=Zophobihabitans entericus TaxID=1635327 RepID=A0A6G9I7U5_9GAMM|nr:penicillin-binding protein activator [Zophobihabitans entericus]QIQ20276.1 hypothetical protein IPMB12_00425 [Zophobihabitans entericus]